MVASDGGVFAFGDAHFAGSCPGIGGCSGAAVAVMPDASGNGYWLVTKTGNSMRSEMRPLWRSGGTDHGGHFSRSHAQWRRLLDSLRQWCVAPYGDAGSYGEDAGAFGGLNPATAIFTTSDGDGYWIASANGTVDQYGDAPNDGGCRVHTSTVRSSWRPAFSGRERAASQPPPNGARETWSSEVPLFSQKDDRSPIAGAVRSLIQMGRYEILLASDGRASRIWTRDPEFWEPGGFS